ncbi:MAG: hypothetical protein K6L73_08990 [Cellvibrionaceae bacterium]
MSEQEINQESVAGDASSEQPQKQNININLPQIATLACNLLHSGFIKNSKDKARGMYKELKSGKVVTTGTINFSGKLDMDLKLALDVSEFKGPGLSFPAFEVALKALLQNLGDRLNNKQELNILTSETGSILLHHPGVVRTTETQVNVMVMTIEPTPGKKELTVRLMFVNPDQFEKKDSE